MPNHRPPNQPGRRSFLGSVGLLGAGAAGFTLFGGVAACGRGDDDASGSTGGAAPAIPDGPIRIGFIIPQTGPLASAFAPTYFAPRIAIDEINAAGGLLGHELEIVEVDDEASPAQAPAAVRQLVDEDIHLVVGPTGSSQVLSALAATTPEKMIQAGFSAADEIANAEEYPYHYMFLYTTTQQANVVTDYVVDELGIDRVGIIAESTAYGDAATEASKVRLGERDLEPVEVQTYAIDATNLTPQVRALRDAGAETILTWFGGGLGAELTMRSMTDLQFVVPLAGHTSMLLAQNVEGLDDEILENSYGVYYRKLTWTDDEEIGEPQQAFADALNAMDGSEGLGAAIAAGGYYDFVRTVADVIEAEETTDPDAIKAAMDSLSGVETLLGEVTFSPDDHAGLRDEDIVMAQAASVNEPQANNVFRRRA